MLEFHKVRLADRPWIHELLYAAGRQGCEYSFANLYFWLQDGVTRVGDFLCAEAHWGGSTSWYFPAGQGDPREKNSFLSYSGALRQKTGRIWRRPSRGSFPSGRAGMPGIISTPWSSWPLWPGRSCRPSAII